MCSCGIQLVLYTLLSSIVCIVAADSAVNYESKLLKDLTEDYNPHARPISEVHQAINVSIAFYLTKILNLDEKNQVLTTFGWLEVHWKDEFLQWNVSQYGGLTRIVVPPQLIWLPDFGLENSAEKIMDDDASEKFRVEISHQGQVQWSPGGVYQTSCELDIRLYPFDSQSCELDFVDWTYDGRHVNLFNASSTVGMDMFQLHGQWVVHSTEASRSEHSYDSDPGIFFPMVKFVLHLNRKPMFYMFNMVIPCLLMSILGMLVFYLPPESNKKICLQVTVFLSLTFLLVVISESLPKNSKCFPLIAMYLTSTMVLTTLSLVLSTVVLDLYHHDANTPVPTWMRRFVFHFIARIVHACTIRCSRERHCPDLESYDENMTQELREAIHEAHVELEKIVKARNQPELFDEVAQHLREITSTFKCRSQRKKILSEWKTAAETVDRFLMKLFCICFLGFSLGILVLYPMITVAINDSIRN